MRREEVIRRIHENYGLWLSPKTVSENATIYKALSEGKNPVMDFHQLGKKGYLMGKSSSQFSFGELVWILDHFAVISPEARAIASRQLRPFATESDWSLLKKVEGLFTQGYETEGFSDHSAYFPMIAMVAKAFASHQEIRFFHEYISPSRGILIQESIRLMPLKLFLKNGQYYVFGIKLREENNKDPGPLYFYFASFFSVHDLSLGPKHSRITMASCFEGETFNLETYLAKPRIIHEGVFSGARKNPRPISAVIFGTWALVLSRRLYGDRIQVNATYDSLDPKGLRMTIYDVELHLMPLEVMSWYFLFASRVYLPHQSEFFEKMVRHRSRIVLRERPPQNKAKLSSSKV